MFLLSIKLLLLLFSNKLNKLVNICDLEGPSQTWVPSSGRKRLRRLRASLRIASPACSFSALSSCFILFLVAF
ncbi:hypothetical protein PR003_g13901 [Phytophthora rubi]|uniref:Uncharacterized protein n=1 Tax=Phytophthora rubi TaxID=129364 RepID=A0A6A3LPC9_9STRA|nr:hypothetical protein PR002_g13215 [Phytophthora rubi]KAE9050146.1 hypothetical protein PR001_g2661 [Phytophthora rubi]KAE9333691.1 hypothetical protein PR003_g13901 [Phytophthora rubi]